MIRHRLLPLLPNWAYYPFSDWLLKLNADVNDEWWWRRFPDSRARVIERKRAWKAYRESAAVGRPEGDQ